jgi:hypothetical protein
MEQGPEINWKIIIILQVQKLAVRSNVLTQ